MTTLLYTLQDGAAGGTERRVLQVSRRLRDRGYNVIVAIPRGGEIGQHLRRAGVPTEEVRFLRLRRSRNPLYYLAWLFMIPFTAISLYLIIRKHNVDVVYNNQFTQVQTALAAKIANRKLIWHLIELHLPPFLEFVFFPIVCRSADCIVVSSDCRGQRLRQLHGYQGPYIVMHAPVDTTRFCPPPTVTKSQMTLRRQLNFTDDVVMIGTVCNINRNKGIEVFLEVASRLSTIIPEARYVVIGPVVESQRDYYEGLLELRRQLGLNDHFLFLGEREDIPNVLSSLDIFILSSWSESSPLVVLEAMAMELPVVASRVGGVPEIIADDGIGLICTPGDVADFTNVLEKLAKNPKVRTDLGRAARAHVEANFSLDFVVDRVELLIRNFEVR